MIQHEQRRHAVVGKPLPRFGEREIGQRARFAKERALARELCLWGCHGCAGRGRNDTPTCSRGLSALVLDLDSDALRTTMPNDATERLRQDWDSQANQWYEQREALFAASRPIHEWLVRHLEPRDGQRVLEIAAGPGDTGFLVAPLLGSGRLVSTDLSPSMVDAARKRGAELGITNADYRTLDAQAMDLGDALLDGAICRWGFMLMPDPLAALRVMSANPRRQAAGLVFAVFTGPEKNPFASGAGADSHRDGTPAAAIRHVAAGNSRPRRSRSTRVSPRRSRLCFAPYRGRRHDVDVRRSDAYWRFLIDLTALGPLIRSISDDARGEFRDRLNARLETRSRAAPKSRCPRNVGAEWPFAERPWRESDPSVASLLQDDACSRFLYFPPGLSTRTDFT